jgi:hypothetical protein
MAMDGPARKWHKGNMDGTDPGRPAPARRLEELSQRIQELHERNTEIATMRAGSRTPDAGSSQEQVRRAEELASLASERAAEAARRAAAMYLSSATAHERAARMHLLLADTGAGDHEDHRHRAQRHLQLAAQDRAVARHHGGGEDKPGGRGVSGHG